MESRAGVAIKAHYDGKNIVLDEPFELEPDTELLVTIVPSLQEEVEREEWFELAVQMLARAYGDDEPDYDNVEIKIPNPDYDPN